MKVKAKLTVHEHLLDESDHRCLSPEQIYPVVGIDSTSFRVINDAGEPVLYAKELFDIVDPIVPNDWVEERDGDEYYIDPPEFCEPGFYEDYFDNVEYALEKFNAYRRLHGLPERKDRNRSTH
ncbi:hypothetical protein [Chitinimonas naiadis]